MTSTSVRVALRVRPLNANETIKNSGKCLSFISGAPEILFGRDDRSFAFDYVFHPDIGQEEIFNECSQLLVDKLLEGYNSTILAYGQTGSGKTYSMGMGTTLDVPPENQGIVPRAIRKLFEGINKRKENCPSHQFEVYVSFLELYNENLVDLLKPQGREKKKRRELVIREDANGRVFCAGVKEVPVSSPEELLIQLQKGSLRRTVASTNANSVSSRSHAIFSVILKQTKIENLEKNKENKTESSAALKKKGKPKSLTSKIVSKFHLVDLAGSERLKRTNSVGNRAKEGIAINEGLLALGNVISALCDESRKVTHIPYRDSKLTRLLQDSLGGNSQTLMLACVSPADLSSVETLNTLKYANRARNIRNKVSIDENYGGNSEISQLRGQISRLKMEIQTLRVDSGIEEVSRKYEEEIKSLKGELKMKLNNTQEQLSLANAEKNSLLMQIDSNNQSISDVDREYRMKTHHIIQKYEAEILSLKNQIADLQVAQSPRKSSFAGTTPEREINHINFTESLINEPDSRKASNNNDDEKKGKNKKKHSSRISNESSLALPVVPPSSHQFKRVINPLTLEVKNLSSHYSDEDDTNEGKEVGLDKEKENNLKSSIKSENHIDRMVASRSVSFSEIKTIEVHVQQEYRFSDQNRQISRCSSKCSQNTTSSSDEQDNTSSDEQDIIEERKRIALMTRMLDQIQSDISVKGQLVSQLERAEQEYTYMKTQYEQKLNNMQEALNNLLREKNAATKLKNRFEYKMRSLNREIVELRRKCNKVIQPDVSLDNRNDKGMYAKIEQPRSENLSMREGTKRGREMNGRNQRVIQNRRKEKDARSRTKEMS